MSTLQKPMSEADETLLRAQECKPVTIWVPDFNNPDMAAEYARQSRLLAEADARDPTIDSFSEAALRDLAEDLDRLERGHEATS